MIHSESSAVLGKSFDKASFKLIRNLQIRFPKVNEVIGEK